MEEYKGYSITIGYSKGKSKYEQEYPFIAVATKGLEVIKKSGYSEGQAISLVKCEIDNIPVFQKMYEDKNK